MSAKYSFTTADYLPWSTAVGLVKNLFKDRNYRMSLLFGTGIFFGLRISDLRQLTWKQILDVDSFIINEKKTGKRREIRINRGFQAHIRDCHDAMKIDDDNQPCFLNRFGSIMSLQMINRDFKAIKVTYNLKIGNFSTHSMRKTWARAIWEKENSEGRGELALLKLSEMLNHVSPSITRRYIGLRREELGEVYDSLLF